MNIRDETYEKLKRNKYISIEDVEEVIKRDKDSIRIDTKVKARGHFDGIIRSYNKAKRQYIQENKKKTPRMVFSEGDEIKIHDSWCRYVQTEVFYVVCENECDFYGKCNATEMFKRMNLYKDKEA